MDEPRFEEALEKLEKIVQALEAGELGLEESLKKYEEGINLCNICAKKLEAARKKVELLKKSGDKFALEEFGGEGQEDAPQGQQRPKPKKQKKQAQDEGLF